MFLFTGLSGTVWSAGALPFELPPPAAAGCQLLASPDILVYEGKIRPVCLAMPVSLVGTTVYWRALLVGDPAAPLLATKGVATTIQP